MWRDGYELCRELGIKPRSMYPILMCPADRGLLDTAWETDGEPGRPPRRLYRLSRAGIEFAAELVATSPVPADVGRTARLRPVRP